VYGWAASLVGLLASGGCGSDVNVTVRFTSGTVSETARCGPNGGQFPLRQPNGLVISIFVTDDTTIVRAGFSAPAGCSDIDAGDHASVTGVDDKGGLRAERVELD
jgi:hypothetical protein